MPTLNPLVDSSPTQPDERNGSTHGAKLRHQVQPLGWTSVTLAVLISATWGGNAVATRFALDALPPIATAGVRFTLAALVMLIWCRIEGCGLLLRRHQIMPALILGFLLFVQIATFNLGIQLSNASHGVLLVNTSIFWVLLIEHFFTGAHRLTGRKTLGVLLAAAGTVLVVATSASSESTPISDAPTLLGDVVLVASSLVLSVKILYTRRAVRTVEPGKLIFWHDVIGVLLFASCSFLAGESISLEKVNTNVVVSVLYMGILVGGICFATNAVLLKKHAASQIAIFGFAAPLFGITVAQLLRNEPFTFWLPIAAGCVAVGIVLVNLRTKANDEQVTSDQ